MPRTTINGDRAFDASLTQLVEAAHMLGRLPADAETTDQAAFDLAWSGIDAAVRSITGAVDSHVVYLLQSRMPKRRRGRGPGLRSLFAAKA